MRPRRTSGRCYSNSNALILVIIIIEEIEGMTVAKLGTAELASISYASSIHVFVLADWIINFIANSQAHSS